MHISACVTCVFWGAHARVVVDSIHAGGVVLTVVVFTVIDVDLTGVTFEALRTHTPENKQISKDKSNARRATYRTLHYSINVSGLQLRDHNSAL